MANYKNLSQNYYKGKTTRYHGLTESTTWWFTGATSFMSNGYSIYRRGLGGYEPNPTAVSQGLTYEDRMFNIKSTNIRASYGQFLDYLRKIIAAQSEIEERYLRLKLEQLRKINIIDPSYLDQIAAAVEGKDYNTAYTLLLRRDKDLEKFKQEVSSNRFKSFQKTNEFWSSQFSKFIQNKLQQQIEAQAGSDVLHLDFDTDFSSLVDEFLTKILDSPDVKNNSLNFIKKQFIDGLKKVFENFSTLNFDIVLKDNSMNVTDITNSKLNMSHFITKKGKFRKPSAIAKNIADAVYAGIGRGLSTEVYAIGSLQKIGAKGLATGELTKEIKNEFTGEVYNVQQKADAIGFEVFNADIDIDSIVDEIYAQNVSKNGENLLSAIEKRVNEALESTSVGEMFELTENIKGYTSNYNLQIEGEGNFYNRMSNLKKIDLGGNMTSKLIFMLNNTTKGCIADGRVSEIADYLAAVAVAWMWDDYEEIFNISDTPASSRINRVHLFNSGGAYFTASQILQQTLENLEGDTDPNKFVNVKINPASPYPDSDYISLRGEVPISKFAAMSKDEQQKELKREWDIVKDYTMKNGTMSIDFNQKQLDELLSGLRTIFTN